MHPKSRVRDVFANRSAAVKIFTHADNSTHILVYIIVAGHGVFTADGWYSVSGDLQNGRSVGSSARVLHYPSWRMLPFHPAGFTAAQYGTSQLPIERLSLRAYSDPG